MWTGQGEAEERKIKSERDGCTPWKKNGNMSSFHNKQHDGRDNAAEVT